jgi:hypothetical protein
MSSLPRLRLLLLAPLLATALSGCGVLAAPCRIASAVIKMVPVIGHPAAVPTDTCAAIIDP